MLRVNKDTYVNCAVKEKFNYTLRYIYTAILRGKFCYVQKMKDRSVRILERLSVI